MQNSTQTDALAKLAVHVCEDWQLIDLDEAIMGDKIEGALEHLIHEMCHAASIGIKWGRHASTDVGAALSQGAKGYFGAHTPLALAEETRVWAIEWNVWQFFDLPFEWGDLECGAEVQGCDPSEIKDLTEHQYIQDLASEVYQGLLDFLRDYERKMQQCET